MATQTSLVATKDGGHKTSPGPYTIVRKTTHLDRMFYLYHRLGIQSNVVVAARYASAESGEQRLVLSDEAVFSALHAVVTKYPELGIFGVVEPCEDNKHILSLASLHTINLESCVEFLDDAGVSPGLLEKLHSQWDWADAELKQGQPWWKVLVLGRREIVFVFHHLVCDGSFGMTFHREFLTALNAAAASGARLQSPRQVQLDPERVRLNDKVETAIRRKPPMLGVLYNLFRFIFFRFFYSKALFFVDLPKPRPFLKDPMAVAKPAERTVTKITNYRIPADKTNAIVAACREHGTTFTPFLMTLITGTLAADFYPKAKVGFTRYAVDVRAVGDFENLAGDQGRMLNLAASVPEPEWLKKYRHAFSPLPPLSEKNQQPKANVDSKAAWDLVQDYGKRMKEMRIGGEESPLYRSWISGNAMGPTLEEFGERSLASIGMFMQNSFSVSNVGALKPAPASPAGEDPTVRIEDVQFSTGSPHGAIGYHGIVFNTAGVLGGDTVINACTEEGMAPEGMARAVLDGVMARVDAILK